MKLYFIVITAIGKILHERKSWKAFDQLKDGVNWTWPKEKDELKKVLEQMLESEPENRPMAEECKNKLRKFVASDHGMNFTTMAIFTTKGE